MVGEANGLWRSDVTLPVRGRRVEQCGSTDPESRVPAAARGGRSRALPGGSPPDGAAEQDLQGELGRAAGGQEVDRVVEVDVEACREHRGRSALVPRALQLAGPPALDPLLLRLLCFQLSRSHLISPSSRCTRYSSFRTPWIPRFGVIEVKLE